MKQQITKLSVPDYNAIQALRSSHLKEFLKSPARYKWCVDHPKEYQSEFPKAAGVLGTYVHAKIAEPETLKDTFVVLEEKDRRSKTYSQKAAIAYSQGKEPILLHEKEEGDLIAASALSDPYFASIVEQSYVEVAAIAQIKGVWCKVRADLWIDQERGRIIDMKTTSDPVYYFPGNVKKYAYDISAALYVDVFTANGKPIETFTFAVIEKKPPYGIKLFDLDPAYLESARRRYQHALERYLVCSSNDYWPGYNNANPPLLTEDRGAVQLEAVEEESTSDN